MGLTHSEIHSQLWICFGLLGTRWFSLLGTFRCSPLSTRSKGGLAWKMLTVDLRVWKVTM